jgi:hypothetical protein
VWAVPSRRPKHPDEMDAAIAALVGQSLEAQITTKTPHALNYPSQDVSRQTVCAPIVGLRLNPPAEEEHPHGQGLRKVLRVQPFGCTALVRIGNEKRHELLRSSVLEVRRKRNSPSRRRSSSESNALSNAESKAHTTRSNSVSARITGHAPAGTKESDPGCLV